MLIAKNVLWISFSVVLFFVCAWALRMLHPKAVAAQYSNDDKVIFLDQGWSPAVREAYYHISQGSAVMPYDIFLNLEVAGGQELFRSDANSERYGLTPDPVDPQSNPDGLPVGLSKTENTLGTPKGEDI